MLYLPRGAKSGQENGVGQHSGKYRKVWGKAAGEVRKLGGYVQERTGEGGKLQEKNGKQA